MSEFICPFMNKPCSPSCQYFVRNDTQSVSNIIPIEIYAEDIISSYLSENQNSKILLALSRFIPINSGATIRQSISISGYCKKLEQQQEQISNTKES